MQINERKLRRDIYSYTSTFATAYGKKAATEITRMAQQAINQFYLDYTPNYYNRTENLLKNSYSRYYHNNGRKVWGGVRISSSRMLDYAYGQYTKTDVAANAWLHGYHGMLRDGQVIQTFPPIAMLKQTIGLPRFREEIRAYAEKEANKKNYCFKLKGR